MYTTNVELRPLESVDAGFGAKLKLVSLYAGDHEGLATVDEGLEGEVRALLFFRFGLGGPPVLSDAFPLFLPGNTSF